MWWVPHDIAVPIASVSTAAGVVAKSAIKTWADVRRAEIEARTRRLEIEAETERLIVRESAETERRRYRYRRGPRIGRGR
jgi:hypothetical protein